MREASEFHDVIVVGAGAAGLTCAARLAKAGRDVLVLESRARIGGRVFSVVDRRQQCPVELGAEFMHGAPRVTVEILERAGLSFYDLRDHHLQRSQGKLRHPDFFARIEGVLAKLNPKRKQDRSVAEFLHGLRASPELKTVFRAFVEGFHAADTEIIGEKALIEAGESREGELNGVTSFRTTGPYIEVLEQLKRDVPEVELHTRLREVNWKAGEVLLTCQQGETVRHYRANRLVVTVPVGVLKAAPERDGVLFNPYPEALGRVLSAIEMGHVQKLTFEFRERFWEKLSGEPVEFLHAGPDFAFPVWWTTSPMRSPFLTAWQGGPTAAKIAGWDLAARVSAALKTLSYISGHTAKWLKNQMVGVHTHNWSQDPNSFGAYTYVRKDGMPGSRVLSKPVENTLYFAGEGFALSSARGTVHGALESGYGVADQILKT